MSSDDVALPPPPLLPQPAAADETLTPVVWDLEEVARSRRVEPRDCRDCKNFDDQDDDLAYGWCRAHVMFVKLAHPQGSFYSQCQFQGLSREIPGPRANPPEVGRPRQDSNLRPFA